MSEKKSSKKARKGDAAPAAAAGGAAAAGPARVGGRSAAAGDSPMNVDLLEQIVRLMQANDLNTVDVRDGDKRVILKRGAVQSPQSPAIAYAPAASAAPQTTSRSGDAAPAASADDTAGLVAIKSPMVGTFYTAVSPDAKPFVSVGSTVDDDTDVCIIEAMKVFNNIKAETRGTIARILATNGQPVEFGQTLFLVKPS